MQADIAAYVARLRCEDIFVEDGPSEPVKPITIRNILALLRQYLDALVSSGRPIESIVSLDDLVDRESIRAAFGYLTRRTGKQASSGAKNILATLIAIATHHVRLPEADVKRLRSKRFFGKAAMDNDRSFGMTAKNMARLAQFGDPLNLLRLTGLSEHLLGRAKSKPDASRSALDAMYATAITILLVFPIRMANLASLDIEKHLTWSRRGTRRHLTIRIEGVEVKNRQHLEVDVKEEISKLIWTYLQDFRPKICEGKGTALFPWRAMLEFG